MEVTIVKLDGSTVKVECTAEECSKCAFAMSCLDGTTWSFIVGTEAELKTGDIIF